MSGALVFAPVVWADKVILHDDFHGVAVDTRPAPPYDFQGMPPAPPSVDGLIATAAERPVLKMQRPQPDGEYPMPSVTRVFPRQSFESGREIELSFDIRAMSDQGSTIQFHVRNAMSGAEGDGQMVYFKPAQGLWLLDAERNKHVVLDEAWKIGVWYRVIMAFDLAKRSVQVTVRNAENEEIVGQSPQVELFGKGAAYLDRFVIARAESPSVYDYEITNLTLLEK